MDIGAALADDQTSYFIIGEVLFLWNRPLKDQFHGPMNHTDER